MSSSLKSQASKGVFWSAIDKFAIQGSNLVITVVLARLLMPSDFGLIGMLSIFIAISQTFVESGMEAGLIQKKDRTNADYSTVFIFNFLVSVLFYIILYFTAPYIADFYNTPQLVLLTRILSLNIIINSLAIVQRSKLTIELDFKTIAQVNVVSVLISGLLAIFFAYKGFGVWALVFQNIIRTVVSVLMFWILSKWKPIFIFSKQSFKSLFGFGSKLLLSGLYAMSFREVYNITIGKFYSSSDLGFYNRSLGFADVTAGTITGILQQVTYPVLASLQDDKTRLVSVYSRLIKMTAFFVFPLMTLLALLSEPFIMFFLTEKWAPAIVLLQWLCFARFFYPLSAINMNILNAVGRSDLFLKVDLSKAPLMILSMVITIPMGVKAIVIGMVIVSTISFFINAYMPGKLFGYGAIKQLKDMIPIFISIIIMSFCVYLSIQFITFDLIKLIVGGIVGVLSYWISVNILKVEETKEIKSSIEKVLIRLKVKK